MENIQTTQQTTSPAVADGERDEILTPRVDIFESEKDLLVVADLPGVSSDALAVNVESGELAFEGSLPKTTESSPSRKYRRSFRLGRGVDTERISAELSNGVLRVKLPKVSAQGARKIEVRGG